jgi:hypothetical protein
MGEYTWNACGFMSSPMSRMAGIPCNRWGDTTSPNHRTAISAFVRETRKHCALRKYQLLEKNCSFILGEMFGLALICFTLSLSPTPPDLRYKWVHMRLVSVTYVEDKSRRICESTTGAPRTALHVPQYLARIRIYARTA